MSNIVFRWKQKIQEFGPTTKYIKGEENIEADTLSCLPIDSMALEVMLNHPTVDPHNLLFNKNLLDLEFIQHHQNEDLELMKVLKEDKNFLEISIGNFNLVHNRHNEFAEPKIVIHHNIQYSVIK